MEFSIFPELSAKTIKRKSADWAEIVKRLENPSEYPSKRDCPLFKLATFDDKRTEKGSLRSDENMLQVYGLIGDYDDEEVSVEEAAQRLEQFGVEAFFYTSASHTPDRPRWRVLAPLSKPYEASEHNRLMFMLDEALGFILAEESYTTSQSFYYGRVAGVEYETRPTNGSYIDDLEYLMIGEWDGGKAKTNLITQKGEQLPQTKEFDTTWAFAISDETYLDLRSALAFMPSDDRVLWIANGQALKASGERGRGLWMEWSQLSDKFDPDDAVRVWDSFKPTRTSYEAIFAKAQSMGWVNPRKSIATTKHTDSRPKILFNGSIDDLFADVILEDEDVQKMAEAEFLIPDMLVRGHVHAFVSPGNGGKTTLFVYISAKLAAMGLNVLYVNVDGSPGDLKRHHEHAKQHGYKVIAPDAKDGKSTNDVLAKLWAIAEGNASCDNLVLIFDTLKKFTDVIDKRKLKEMLQLVRTLTVKGATIILLGHTNKHAGEDGKQVFEGTADLRNDVDELIYLDSTKNEALNRLEVTTRPDKVRADFSPKSFIIHLDDERRVEESETVIPILSKEAAIMLELFKDAIRAGNHSQKAIIEYVKPKSDQGLNKIRRTLNHFTEGKDPALCKKLAGIGADFHYSIPSLFNKLELAEEF